MLRLAAILGFLALFCAGITYLFSCYSQPTTWKHDEPSGHHWLHQQLNLTPEEAARVDAFEEPYRRKRQELLTELSVRIEALAETIRNAAEKSAEVGEAVEAVHEVHGQIQALAISHYFEMLSVLPPEKQDKLRELAVEALSHSH